MQVPPLVSIIIPTYNDGQLVCQAIDSSLNQTYKNLEIIVVDDGSADNTEEMLTKKYRDKIKYIRQENKGNGGARNTGIRYSSGKYLQFLDSDDLLDPDKINIQINELQKLNDNAICFCDYVCCDIEDMSIVNWYLSPKIISDNPLDDIILKWETELCIPIHCFLFDAVFFKNSGILFDENLPNHVDWDCWMRIFSLNPRMIYIDKSLVYYRLRKNSITRGRANMRKGYLKAIDKQITVNKLKVDIVNKLIDKKKITKLFYRDVGPVLSFLEKYNPIFKKIYLKYVPWRLQRMLD